MNREQADAIFETDLGQQILSFYCTSDNKVFIRHEEAVIHTNNMINSVGGTEYIDTTITEWFPE